MVRNSTPPDLLEYLASKNANSEERFPTLQQLSEELGMSIPRLREQLEVAKVFGFVDVRPRTGIKALPYSFYPPVFQSLNYAIKQDRVNFDLFSDLRNHLEAAYWTEAVEQLTASDLEEINLLLERAWNKLLEQPIRIPHSEHKELHVLLFRRLQNPFVSGILEAYWDAYEAVGLNLFTDYDYLTQVWTYHTTMVEAIHRQDYNKGYEALTEHKDLLRHRPDVVGLPE